MTTPAKMDAEQATVRHWLREVSKSALLVERRWTQAALKRVDADLARRLDEQRDLFDRAVVTGSSEDVEKHGAAMCRGYAVAAKTLDAAGEPDDSYVLGQDARTGFRVAIGHQKAAADRVAELHGRAVVYISPDEVAAVLAGLEGFKAIATIKLFFPGAEVVDVRPGEPAKSDSGIEAA